MDDVCKTKRKRKSATGHIPKNIFLQTGQTDGVFFVLHDRSRKATAEGFFLVYCMPTICPALAHVTRTHVCTVLYSSVKLSLGVRAWLYICTYERANSGALFFLVFLEYSSEKYGSVLYIFEIKVITPIFLISFFV